VHFNLPSPEHRLLQQPLRHSELLKQKFQPPSFWGGSSGGSSGASALQQHCFLLLCCACAQACWQVQCTFFVPTGTKSSGIPQRAFLAWTFQLALPSSPTEKPVVSPAGTLVMALGCAE
jgi:hypothetical protein